MAPTQPTPAVPAPVARKRERRIFGRSILSAGAGPIACDRGRIIDFSSRGMRLATRSRWAEGQCRAITVTVEDHDYHAEARCIWCRQDGLFSHVVGIAIESAPPDLTAALERLTAAMGCEH